MSAFKFSRAVGFALIAISIVSCAHTDPVAQDKIPWRTDYAAALAEGKQAGKPILIDFSATWCPTCQQMKRTSWPDQRVNQLVTSAYIPLTLDVDAPASQDPAHRYGVDVLPVILVVDSDGKVLRQSSYMSANDLAKFLAVR
jgi:thiol:disulfide interchange protein